jgi:EmrB/QacA subfamily drug resistance transporter
MLPPLLLVASLSALLGSLDTSVNIAFPAMTEAFQLDVTMMQWVVVSYVLTYASLLLSCGRLADLWGHARLLSVGLVLSAVAFIGCGLAPSFGWLLVARVGQGVAAALVLGAAPALVTLSVAAEERGRALGIFQMSAAAGFAIGPLLGGVLVDGFGWRAVYLFRVAPALVLAWFAAQHAPAQVDQNDQRFDLLGALTLAGGVAGFLLAVSRGRDLGWTSPLVLLLFLAASVCTIGFVVTEQRVSAPVVKLSLFRQPAFSIANLLNLLANCSMFAIWLLVPHYLVKVLHYPATVAGLLLLPAALTTALAAPLAGRLSDQLGTSRISSLGLGLEVLGLWLMSTLDAGVSYVSVAIALGVVGLGLVVFQAPNMSFVMGSIPRTQQGVAGSMTQLMRTLGVVIGVSGASMLFDSRRLVHTGEAVLEQLSPLQGFMPAFQDVFLLSACLCGLACGLSVLRGKSG